MEFIEILEIPRLPKNKDKRIQAESPVVIKYKGADWTTLVVADNRNNNNEYSIGVFIGFKNGLSLPDRWSANIHSSWELLHPITDEVISKGFLKL